MINYNLFRKIKALRLKKESCEYNGKIKALLAQNGIKFDIRLKGTGENVFGETSLPCDVYVCTISNSKGIKYSFDFNQSFHYSNPSNFTDRQASNQLKSHYGMGNDWHDWKATFKGIAPNIADCLYGVVLCGEKEPFDVFCDNLGYSKDSIKALNIYQRVCNDIDGLMRVFGYDVYNQAQLILEGY